MSFGIYVRRWLIIIAAVVALVVVVAYFAFRTSSIRVENNSSVLISNIRVAMSEKIFWTGSLLPGESHRAFGFVPKDGDIVIIFMQDSMEHRNAFADVTTLWPDHHVLKITQTMKVECSSIFKECAELKDLWRQDAIDKFLAEEAGAKKRL